MPKFTLNQDWKTVAHAGHFVTLNNVGRSTIALKGSRITSMTPDSAAYLELTADLQARSDGPLAELLVTSTKTPPRDA